jgi:hypothetical protein
MRRGRILSARAERLTLLAVLAFTVGAVAPATAQTGRGRRANRFARQLFALAAPGGGPAARTMGLHAASGTQHVPSRAFAGYVTHHTGGVTQVVAYFKVPDVKCTHEQRAVGPGAFLLTGPTDHEVFNAANVIVGCSGGAPVGFPVLLVNDTESNFSRPLAAGESIMVRLTDDPGRQTVVQLSNLTPHHRYTLTKSGRGNIPNSQLVGYWATENVKTGTELTPPDIRPTTFSSVSIDGRPLGSRGPVAYDMTDANRAVLIATSPLMGPAKDVFTCTRTGN